VGGRDGGRDGGGDGGREGWAYLRERLVREHAEDPVDIHVGGDGRDASVIEEAEGFGYVIPVEGGVGH